MRGHGVGVGDVCEVQGWVWVQKDAPGGDDGRVTVGKREPGVVGGRGGSELDSPEQWRRDRIGIDDNAWVEHGVGRLHGAGSTWADDMREDGVGVGDVGEVSDGAGSRGHSAGGDDGRVAIREHEPGMVGGRGGSELDSPG